MLNLVADILLPPASLAVLALLLLIIRPGGRVGATVAVGLLIILGLPVVATALLNSLAPPAMTITGPEPAAIVILSADGVRTQGPIDLDPGPLTLDRTRAGAALARRTGLPILVSGGTISGSNTTLAAMMGKSLRDDFGLDPRWQETRSRDTWETLNSRRRSCPMLESGASISLPTIGTCDGLCSHFATSASTRFPSLSAPPTPLLCHGAA